MIGSAALAIVSGLAYAASEPPWGIWWLAFASLVPLFAAVVAAGRSPLRRFSTGWIAGTIACSLLTSWPVYVAVDRYFSVSTVARILAAVLVPQAYGAPWFGVFAVVAGPALCDSRSVARSLVVVPAAWVACELGRSTLGHGLPWVLLAHSQLDVPLLLQPAAWGGAYAVSFFVVLVNLLVWNLGRVLAGGEATAGAVRRVLAVGSGLAMALAVFALELDRWRSDDGHPAVGVALVQAEVPASWGGRLAQGPEILRRLSERTRRATADEPSLIVWPENALGFVAEANPERLRRAASLLPAGARLLLGSPRVIAEGEARTVRNAALLVGETGEVEAAYAKVRLTPFAESWPRSIPAPTGATDVYGAGTAAPALDWPGGRLGVLICSEAIYPDLARARVDAGAEILVNLANDAWFDGTPAIEQHFAAAALRAVETRRFLLRASNLGVNAVVTPWGEVRRGHTAARGVASARVYPIRRRSAYSHLGDWFAWTCVGGVAFDLLLAGAFRRTRVRKPRRPVAG